MPSECTECFPYMKKLLRKVMSVINETQYYLNKIPLHSIAFLLIYISLMLMYIVLFWCRNSNAETRMHIVFFREEKDGPRAKSKSRMHDCTLIQQFTFLTKANILTHMFDCLEGFSETKSWHSQKI